MTRIGWLLHFSIRLVVAHLDDASQVGFQDPHGNVDLAEMNEYCELIVLIEI